MLERHNSASGNISISGRANSHDDLATVVALCAQKVIWMMPKTAEEVAKVDQHKSPTPHERIMAHIISQKRLEKMLDRRRIRGYD